MRVLSLPGKRAKIRENRDEREGRDKKESKDKRDGGGEIVQIIGLHKRIIILGKNASGAYRYNASKNQQEPLVSGLVVSAHDVLSEAKR